MGFVVLRCFECFASNSTFLIVLTSNRCKSLDFDHFCSLAFVLIVLTSNRCNSLHLMGFVVLRCFECFGTKLNTIDRFEVKSMQVIGF